MALTEHPDNGLARLRLLRFAVDGAMGHTLKDNQRGVEGIIQLQSMEHGIGPPPFSVRQLSSLDNHLRCDFKR